MISKIISGIGLYFLIMMGIIVYKFRKEKENFPNLTFLEWLNQRVMALNNKILLKSVEWQNRKYEKSLKKEQKKKNKILGRFGFK